MPNKEYLLRKPREQYLLQTLEILSFLRLNLKKNAIRQCFKRNLLR